MIVQLGEKGGIRGTCIMSLRDRAVEVLIGGRINKWPVGMMRLLPLMLDRQK